MSVIPGDQIGRDTVRESRVWNQGGILANTVKIGKTNDVRPTQQASVSKTFVSNILTGSVLAVNGTTIQVQFDADAGDMSVIVWMFLMNQQSVILFTACRIWR